MHMKCVPHLTFFCYLEMVDGEEVNNGTKHHSESSQLEKLQDDRKQNAALVSQTRVSLILHYFMEFVEQ